MFVSQRFILNTFSSIVFHFSCRRASSKKRSERNTEVNRKKEERIDCPCDKDENGHSVTQRGREIVKTLKEWRESTEINCLFLSVEVL